jgi:hypothetical protein
MLSKTEYRLTSAKNEQWTQLKRSDGKKGLEFRPLRKVIFFQDQTLY